MEKKMALSQIRQVARRIERADRRRAELMAERDALMRAARATGASWAELQESARMNSPTAVSRSLKRAPTD